LLILHSSKKDHQVIKPGDHRVVY